ncbi:MAG: prepilin-type N-terminal cleavage/methylation domain-containing protein, partial [Deltaproteobacteria bacterium]|nr:prepilin-type N-terminal cleavage/methylation domain-containing protein [Deltaproteobacteria bacterium]
MGMHLGERAGGSQTHSSALESFSVDTYSVGSLMSRVYPRVRGSTSGFTLIEIMVVIIILGIL